MRKRVLASLLLIAVVAGLVGASTWAQFSDVEESSGNIFQAGTIDLDVDGLPQTIYDIKPCEDLSPITVTFNNVGNNEGILTFTFDLSEDDKVWAGEFSGAEWNMSADEFARLVYVKSALFSTTDASYGDVVTEYNQYIEGKGVGNGDGKVSLYEMAQLTWYLDYDHNPATGHDIGPYVGGITPLPSGKSATVAVTFHLGDAFEGIDLSNPESAASWATYKAGSPTWHIVSDGTSVWNVPQADGVDLTVTATLDQVP